MSMNCDGCEYDGFVMWGNKKVSYCKYFRQTKRNMDEIKTIPYHHFQHGWCPHDTRQEQQDCPNCGKFVLKDWIVCPYCGADMRGDKE